MGDILLGSRSFLNMMEEIFCDSNTVIDYNSPEVNWIISNFHIPPTPCSKRTLQSHTLQSYMLSISSQRNYSLNVLGPPHLGTCELISLAWYQF